MTQTNTTDALSMERTFDAPVDLIWQMWTDPDHFARWYGPNGATIPSAEIDLTVGGKRQICMEMEGPNGAMQMWFTGEHREIVDNQRLVYPEAMTDRDGNLLPPEATGMPKGHELTEVTVELEQLGDRTKLTLTHAGIPANSPGAKGWQMALDKLVKVIESQDLV